MTARLAVTHRAATIRRAGVNEAGSSGGGFMSRLRVQFTIGRGMIVVAIAAVLCWLATDATFGPIARAFPVGRVGRVLGHLGTLAAILVLIQLGALAVFWTICGALTWLSDRYPARHDPSPRPPAPSSPDRTPP